MAVKNLVSGTLAGDITTSTTNILVHIADNISAQGILDFFPNPPFYITIMPKAPASGVSNRLDSEIIKITNVGHDQVGNAALTGVRAQRDTTAKAFSTGDIVTAAIYTEDLAGAYSNATTTTAGLMSAEDKTKLDGLSPENIEPITLSDGYSYTENGSFKLGKMVCINCQIKSATALAANQQVRIGTLNYGSDNALVSFATLSDGEWASTSQPCYLFIGTGGNGDAIVVASSIGGLSYIRISISYLVR